MNRRTKRERRNRRNRRQTTAATFVIGSCKSADERREERRKTTRAKHTPCFHANVIQRDDGAYCPDCGGWG